MTISKRMRFEVFKRDKFTCQYCGRPAPDVILELDHIQPIAQGGEDDLLNLVTSCFDCNRGKKDKLLSDDTAIKRRRQQLDRLQERREQLEMMMEWHRSLIKLDIEIVHELANFWDALVPRYKVPRNHWPFEDLKKWSRRFNVNELAEAMRISVQQYIDKDISMESVTKAWKYIPKICAAKRRDKDKPYMEKLYYARGILRNRLSYLNEWQALDLMEQAVLAGVDTDEIQNIAKQVTSWTQFRSTMKGYTNGQETI